MTEGLTLELGEWEHVYLTGVTDRLRLSLGSHFAGCYLHGSLSMNAFQPDQSDIDIIATVRRTLAPDVVEELRHHLGMLSLPQSSAGLDLGVLSLESARHLTDRSLWETSMRVTRAGSGQTVHIGDRYDPMLFVDVELLRQSGVPLAGPSIEPSFSTVPTQLILQACAHNCSVWAKRDTFHDPVSGVLTACRAWCFLDRGTLVSKPEAGEWARTQLVDSKLIDAALARRHGESAPPLPDANVKEFCQRIYQRFVNLGFQ
jgi:Asp/Glu/hydantoin racemase